MHMDPDERAPRIGTLRDVSARIRRLPSRPRRAVIASAPLKALADSERLPA